MENVKNFYIRFFHAIPTIGEIEIHVNGKNVGDLSYKGFTEYYPALIGTYNIEIFLKANKTMPIFSKEILCEQDIYTLSIIGKLDDVNINLVSSNNVKVDPSKAIIRFCNFSLNTNVDILINDKKIISNLYYDEISDFFSFTPGKYYFKAINAENGKQILADPSLTLKAGKIYTGYIVGIENGKPSLQLLIPLEGATYITLN